MLFSAMMLQAAAALHLGVVGKVLGAAVVALAAALGLGKIGKSAMEGIARQPEAAGNIRTSMIIIGALVEGSDVSFLGDRALGIWDDNRFDPESAVGLGFKMDKGESLDYRASAMNHAMCITGVALKNGKATKWKIENSWGTDRGVAGYYTKRLKWE